MIGMNMSTFIFSYQTTYKLGISHTPFELVYGLLPLLPIKYLLPFRPSENRNPQPVRILISRLS
jgi:hypothetical protein